MFGSVDEEYRLEKQWRRIRELREWVYKPFFTDPKYVDTVYKLCTEVGLDMTNTQSRQVLLTVTLIYYCPLKLFNGSKIPKVVISKIDKLLKCGQSVISHNSRNLIFLYQHYKEYRMYVDMVNNRFIDYLLSTGIEEKELKAYLKRYN